MEKNCENKCEGCAIIREWAEEVDEIAYNSGHLWDAAITAYKDRDKALVAFIDVAGEELFLGLNWNKFVEARKNMENDPMQFQELSAELLLKLHKESQGLKHEIVEAQENCPGPKKIEVEMENMRIIGQVCMSPVFERTDGIEPVYIKRIPKDSSES